MGYFCQDLLVSIKTGSVVFTTHHLVMMLCHYPVGIPKLCRIWGAGDCAWATNISCIGYFAEASTPFYIYFIV
eukprot:UN02334